MGLPSANLREFLNVVAGQVRSAFCMVAGKPDANPSLNDPVLACRGDGVNFAGHGRHGTAFLEATWDPFAMFVGPNELAEDCTCFKICWV